MARNRYPVGIQTFSRIIREGYVYIDKTDLVWKLAHYSSFAFLSRPRRFGKSLLTSTLESYFKGERELFEGLKIMDLEKEWDSYPVIRLDLSTAKNQWTPEELRARLWYIIRPYLKEYGVEDEMLTPGSAFEIVMQRAYELTGKQVAVIIDEYDAPLLDVLTDDHRLDEYRQIMQEFCQPLKANGRILQGVRRGDVSKDKGTL